MTMLQNSQPNAPTGKISLAYDDVVFVHNLTQEEIDAKMDAIKYVGPAVAARDLNLTWDSKKYKVGIGEDALLSYQLVKKDFGDSRALTHPQTLLDSIGRKEFVPSRVGEVRRLRAMYNQAFGDYLGDDDGEGAFEKHRIPHVCLYAAEGRGPGQRILTILEDPLGRSVIPVTSTAMDNADLRRMVLEQAEQIKQLTAAYGLDPRSQPLSSDQMNPVIIEEGKGVQMDPRSGRMQTKQAPAHPNPTKKADIPTVD